MRQPAWQRAASFAAKAHEGQFRDDDETPYFAHPCRVALTVRGRLLANEVAMRLRPMVGA